MSAIPRHARLGLDDDTRRALVAHHRKYGIDATTRRRLAATLEALEEHRDAIDLAVSNTGAGGVRSALEVRVALRLLVNGPNGEFR